MKNHDVLLPLSLLLLATSSIAIASCGDSAEDTTGTTGDPAGGCTPGQGCPDVESDCISFKDNAGAATYALRISHLTVNKPDALTDPTITNLLGTGVNLAYTECRAASGDPIFTADGTFSWILQFDTATNTLITGGALIEQDPTKGYCFVNETIGAFDVAPLTADVTFEGGSFSINEPRDVVVPIYTQPDDPTKVILLPLKAVRIFDATVSEDQNCIGEFNLDGLTPNNLCLADNQTPQFVDGASLEGYITLADADNVEIPELGDKSLCALIAGEGGLNCETDADGFVFEGDWCAGAAEGDPGTPATATCKDSMALGATFAASGAILRSDCN